MIEQLISTSTLPTVDRRPPTHAADGLPPTLVTRVATIDDIPFMDALQKKHTKMVGYFPTGQFKGYVEQQAILIACEADTPQTPLGYCIAKDRYLKRDELGVVYQLLVVPGAQRKLIGAALIKAVFERSAYGCRLYCCWCAQDIAANHFWEALGFVPVAFRAGSAGKKRVHIFWQRRINDGDTTTPYWYPFQTNSGAIRQDRLVFPIPPDVHWKDVRAVTVPVSESRTLELPSPPKRARTEKAPPAQMPGAVPAGKMKIFVGEKIKYVDRPGYVAPVVVEPVKKARAKAGKQPPVKFDPRFLAAARELRDRYLEQMNGEGIASLPPKYDVTRRIDDAVIVSSVDLKSLPLQQVRLLPAA